MENKNPDLFETDETGAVEFNRIQVAGIVRDAAGNEWTVPEEDPTGDEFKLYRSPFDIKKEPGFHYQFDHYKDVSQQMAEGFKPCTRAELGMPDFKISGMPSNEYGFNNDGVYMVGDLVALKIPQVLADRRYEAQNRMCRAAVAATEPQAKGDPIIYGADEANERNEALRRMKVGAGRGRKMEMSHKKVRVKPRNPDNEKVA